MKNITIYWSRLNLPLQNNKDLLTYTPFFVYKKLKNVLKNSSSPFFDYMKCPAAYNELKNIIGIKADQDFIFNFKEINNKENLVELNNEGHILVRSVEKKWFDIMQNYTFFSDQDLEVSMIPAYLEDNNLINNTILFTGRYNCSKWYRTSNPSYISKSDKIKIKRGDTLFYLKFHTNKKINLINYKFNSTLEEYMNSVLKVKEYVSNLSLNYIYNLFIKKNYNKRILKEIKNNLTGY